MAALHRCQQPEIYDSLYICIKHLLFLYWETGTFNVSNQSVELIFARLLNISRFVAVNVFVDQGPVSI